MEFLPADYKSPASNNYTKIQDGDNKFRILSQPIIGYEDWKDKKPYRFRQKPLKSFDESKLVKHFWAMIVWNYQEQAIQIFQVTQATIKDTLHALSLDADWGVPYGYDIKITKKGTGKETSYMTIGLPHKPIADHIKEAFYAKRCSLEALFDGSDPFSPLQSLTPAAFEDVVYIEAETIEPEQKTALYDMIKDLNEETKNSFFNWIKTTFNVTSLQEIPKSAYEKCMTSLNAKIKYVKDQERVVA